MASGRVAVSLVWSLLIFRVDFVREASLSVAGTFGSILDSASGIAVEREVPAERVRCTGALEAEEACLLGRIFSKSKDGQSN